MDIIGDDFIPIGFETDIPLSQVSWDPKFFDVENKAIFIVTGPCTKNNIQSLKEIHVWADLEFPLCKNGW